MVPFSIIFVGEFCVTIYIRKNLHYINNAEIPFFLHLIPNRPDLLLFKNLSFLHSHSIPFLISYKANSTVSL